MARPLRLAAQVAAGLGVGLIVTVAFLHLVGGWRIVAIASDSMAPAISRGDLVLVRPTSPADLTNGDLILFSTGEQTRVEVVHRVYSIVTLNLSVEQPDGTFATASQRQFLTKGDANAAPDAWRVDARNLQGRVYAILPGLGWPLLDYPVALLLGALAAVLGLMWVAYELARVLRRRTARVPPEA
ncbi:MAG TPA: signal peptidase I [Patescibacteria group bacterium]|nr:signal peptidase I [Patescibacteria group bacterium]